MKRVVVWFRRDLRLADNPALTEAVDSGLPVEAVFIYPDDEGSALGEGAAARWYLHHSLQSLAGRLHDLGIRMHLLRGDPLLLLPRLLGSRKADSLYWNRILDPEIEGLDQQLQRLISAQGVSCRRFDDDCLMMPEDACKRDGTVYRVFTPFWRNLRSRLEVNTLVQRLSPIPSGSPRHQGSRSKEPAIEELQLLAQHPWHQKFESYWQPGESAAKQRLFAFCESGLFDYESRRDIPAVDGTSRLSPALHFGELSLARIYLELEQRRQQVNEQASLSINRFFAEIGWREFSRHILMAFPESPSRSLDSRFDQPGVWLDDPDQRRLLAWQQGRTGQPLVDAGMKQLWETGWMHNRVRMIVASFLTKNLGIHWRQGAAWFARTLIDADRASNTMGWQWAAGCGCDAAPYYRVFNPETQARKFDPQGRYISHWVDPHRLQEPMVDLKLSRAHALERYRTAVKQSNPQP